MFFLDLDVQIRRDGVCVPFQGPRAYATLPQQRVKIREALAESLRQCAELKCDTVSVLVFAFVCRCSWRNVRFVCNWEGRIKVPRTEVTQDGPRGPRLFLGKTAGAGGRETPGPACWGRRADRSALEASEVQGGAQPGRHRGSVSCPPGAELASRLLVAGARLQSLRRGRPSCPW